MMTDTNESWLEGKTAQKALGSSKKMQFRPFNSSNSMGIKRIVSKGRFKVGGRDTSN